jgi:hypothetical protein
MGYIHGLPSAREHPQDFFNTELSRPCPFIPELKLWAFWAPIFISEKDYRLILSAKIK